MLHGYQQGIKPFWLIYDTVFCKTKMPMMRTECLVSTWLLLWNSYSKKGTTKQGTTKHRLIV